MLVWKGGGGTQGGKNQHLAEDVVMNLEGADFQDLVFYHIAKKAEQAK